jgi:peptidyl-prolyl cis-trans isomerase B (cyclophilin B)
MEARSIPYAAAMAVTLAFSVSVAAAPGCTSERRTADQMHGSALTSSEDASVAVYETEVPLHTSPVQVQGDEVAVITTAKGVFRIRFFPQDAPNHVASFIELAESGFYDGTTFHRVEPGFVVQGGDPYSRTGEGPVGTGSPGWRLKAEFNRRPHLEGTVAMARGQDPDSAGSQFYICLAPAPFLDGRYTVFGEVVEGMDVVKKLQPGDVMSSVRIEHRP